MVIALLLGGYLKSKPVDSVPYVDCGNMSLSDVQDWFMEHKDGKWAEYKSAFSKLDGKELCAMAKEDFLRRVSTDGDVIYNDWRHATTPPIRRELYSIDFEIWVGLGILGVVSIVYVALGTKEPDVYEVGAVVKGALRSHGARGNVYKNAEKFGALFPIRYVGDDLRVQLYFNDFQKACDFQTWMLGWEMHKQLVGLDGVELVNHTPLEVAIPRSTLQRIFLSMYKPGDSESECGSLDQLHSFRLSIPITTVAEPTSDLARYQAIDAIEYGLKPYKLHLKDKAKFKNLQNNENNMVVGSWKFHQFFDGLNTVDYIPVVAISVAEHADKRSAEMGNRYWVNLELEFFQEAFMDGINYKTGTVSVPNSCKKRIVVWVEDIDTFKACVEWKYQDTRTKWNSYNNELNNI